MSETGYYIDLDKGPSHKPFWFRVRRAVNLAKTLRQPDADFPDGIPLKTVCEVAWGIWRDCPCGKCDRTGPWGKQQ